MSISAPDWTTDAELFASLPGGQAVIDWFGFCPDFHDGSLERLELSVGSVLLSVRTFRMTRKTDENGFFIRDPLCANDRETNDPGKFRLRVSRRMFRGHAEPSRCRGCRHRRRPKAECRAGTLGSEP